MSKASAVVIGASGGIGRAFAGLLEEEGAHARVWRLGRSLTGAAHLDAHAMNPDAVFAGVRALGGALPPTVVIGCQVACVAEGIGLSEPVAAAVDEAVVAVGGVLAELLSTGAPDGSEPLRRATARQED